MKTRLWPFACLLAVSGCGDTEHPSQLAAEAVSIEQGIFGAAYTCSDLPDLEDEPIRDMKFWSVSSVPTADEFTIDDLQVLATVQTDQDGFFEFEASPGPLHVCYDAADTQRIRCATFDVPDGTLQCDFGATACGNTFICTAVVGYHPDS